ncbi:MAG: hypothetical protein HOV94_16360 [Saccharothrix sp.]|nr:hypothetical protein [Saccharothrix sp.]
MPGKVEPDDDAFAKLLGEWTRLCCPARSSSIGPASSPTRCQATPQWEFVWS